ncbi:MAG: helix-turn-helix transcriptional regulator [Acidobacteriaceae bacterium]|nr:helix-turn-helix transcriptional regulator [Acidobacteriaceae bacterium]
MSLRETHIMPASQAGVVLMDRSYRLFAADQGARSIFSCGLDLGANNPVQLPIELVDFVRNREMHNFHPIESHVRIGQSKYLCRAYLLESSMEPQRQSSPAPLYVLHIQSEGTEDPVQMVASEYNLTERELEALRGIAQGATSKDIAKRMKISPNTVRSYLRLIMIKMNVSTRAGVVAKILERTRPRSY